MSIPTAQRTRRRIVVALTLGACTLGGFIWAIREKPRAEIPVHSALGNQPSLREKVAALVNANEQRAPNAYPPPRLAIPAEANQARPEVAGRIDPLLLGDKQRLRAARDAIMEREDRKGANLGERVRRLREPHVMANGGP